MPRIIDPGQITVGTGLAANESIETNAFVNPTGGNEGLRVHIADPSRAHEARAINLEDAGGYYTSDHVEGALQELGGAGAAGRTNGLVEGGTFTSVGLTVTMDPTFVLLGGSFVDYTGDSVALVDNTINYLYIDSSTGLLTASTILPSLIADPITLAEITTLAGVVTTSVDARFFVLNLDRKVPFTLRDGTDANARSEASFITFEAALWYLANYAGTGSDPIEKHRLLVRGNVDISSAVVFPAGIEGIIIQGEGGDSGFTLSFSGTAISIASDRVEFRNLFFTCNAAASTAISVLSGDNIIIDNCIFQSGSTDWDTAVYFTAVTTGSRIQNSQVNSASNYGFRLALTNTDCLVDNCVVIGNGVGTAGIVLTDTVPGANQGFSSITNSRVQDFPTGMILRGEQQTVYNSTITAATTGINYDAFGAGGEGRMILDGVQIQLSTTTGETGVFYDGPYGKISNCEVINPRTVWAAEVPIGINQNDTTGSLSVVNTRVEGFANDSAAIATGNGIVLNGPNSSVVGCEIIGCGSGITTQALATHTRIADNALRGVGVGLSVNGANTSVSNCSIECDSTYGIGGISTVGSDNTRISNCRVVNLRSPASYAAEVVNGIQVQGNNSQITNCDIENFYNSTAGNGSGILISGTGVRNIVTGCNITTALTGITIDTASNTGVQISGVAISDVTTGISVAATGCKVFGASINLSTTRGLVGVDAQESDLTVIGSTFSLSRTWTTETDNPIGIHIQSNQTTVSGCTITGFNNDGTSPSGAGVEISAGGSSCKVVDTRISNSRYGVYLSAVSLSDWSIESCDITETTIAGVYAPFGGSERCRIQDTRFNEPGDDYAIFLGDGATNLSVLGNNIDGGNAPSGGFTDYGIRVTGQDGGGERSRRFLISNNNIRQVGIAGVELNGYVQNGVISANQIDGYISADEFNPTAVGIRILSVTGGDLARNITVEGNTVWRCHDGIIMTGDDFTNLISYFTISDNVIHHCGFAQDLSGGVPDTFEGWGSKGIGVNLGSNFTIHGNTIHDIGQGINDLGVAGFPDQGAPIEDVQATGIYLRNCFSYEATGNHIQNTLSENLGGNYGIVNQAQSLGAGSSVIHEGPKISSNNLTWDVTLPGNDQAIHGIMFLAARGTDLFDLGFSQITCNDNTINRTRGSNISIRAGEGGQFSNVLIANNSCVSAGQAAIGEETGGIQLFTEAALTNSVTMRHFRITNNLVSDSGTSGIIGDILGDSDILGISVTDNVVEITQNDGIALNGDTAAATNFQDINISRNDVREYGGSSSLAGIALRDGTSGDSMERITIDSNNLKTNTSADNNIFIECNGAYAVGVPLSEVSISYNTVQGESGAGFAPNEGIDVTLNGNPIRQLKVLGNRIRTSGRCINLPLDSEGSVSQIDVSDNICESDTTGGLDLRLFTTVALVSEAIVRDVKIQGNTIVNGGGDSAVSVEDGIKLWNFTVSGNQFRDSSVGLNVTMEAATLGVSSSARNWLVSNNTFDSAEDEGLVIDLGLGVLSDTSDNIVVSSNVFAGCSNTNNNAALRMDMFSVPQGIHVTNNIFRVCGVDPTNNDTTGTLEVRLGSNEANNINICDNSFDSCAGTAIYLEEVSGSAGVANLTLSRNSIQTQTGNGIKADLAAFSTTDTISICGNTIHDLTPGAGSEATGIYLIGASTSGLVNVQISGNVLSDVGDTGDSQPGIYVLSNDDIVGLTINDNVIEDSDYFGINVESDGMLELVSIQGNNIGDSDEAAIEVVMTGTDVGATGKAINISNNVLQDSRGGSTLMNHGISISSDDVSVNMDVETLNISGNVIENAASDSININSSNAVDSGDYRDVVVNNNSILCRVATTTSESGISFTANGGDLINATFNGNTVRGPNASGINITTFGGIVQGLSVCGNSIFDWAQRTTGGTSFSGIIITPEDGLRTCNVSNNTLTLNTVGGSTSSYAIHFNTLTDSEVRVLNICNNSMFLGDNVVTALQFTAGVGSGSQNNVLITGNNARGHTGAVANRSSAGFDPTTVTIANNMTNEASDWDTFAAVLTGPVTIDGTNNG